LKEKEVQKRNKSRIMKSSKLIYQLIAMACLVALFSGCDDGKLDVKSIDFTSVSIQSCSTNNLLYKNNGTELLILDIPLTTFKNDATIENNPIVLNLSNTNRVIYRAYNGAVSSSNICPILPSTTPQVQQEWVATNGVVLITSSPIKTFNSTTNATRITGYKHNIVFRNLSWNTPNGQVVWAYDYPFGDYQINVSQPTLDFGASQSLSKIACDQRVFACNGGESMELKLANATAAFASVVTPIGSPRVIGLDDNNKVTYRNYINGLINPDYYCAISPTTPTINEMWIGQNGVSTISGWIEVETIVTGANFKHTVTLCKLTFQKGNSTFYLADRFLLGTLLTN